MLMRGVANLRNCDTLQRVNVYVLFLRSDWSRGFWSVQPNDVFLCNCLRWTRSNKEPFHYYWLAPYQFPFWITMVASSWPVWIDCILLQWCRRCYVLVNFTKRNWCHVKMYCRRHHKPSQRCLKCAKQEIVQHRASARLHFVKKKYSYNKRKMKLQHFFLVLLSNGARAHNQRVL